MGTPEAKDIFEFVHAIPVPPNLYAVYKARGENIYLPVLSILHLRQECSVTPFAEVIEGGKLSDRNHFIERADLIRGGQLIGYTFSKS